MSKNPKKALTLFSGFGIMDMHSRKTGVDKAKKLRKS